MAYGMAEWHTEWHTEWRNGKNGGMAEWHTEWHTEWRECKKEWCEKGIVRKGTSRALRKET
jgi:hypothetical protein